MKKHLLAIVGMPGSGKTEAVSFLKNLGFFSIRFGEQTDTALREKGLPLTQENERAYREQIRKELGMAAYAIKAKPDIDALLKNYETVIIDGLYSWEEYVFLKNAYPILLAVHVFAESQVRYQRLGKRPIRPLTPQECRARDVLEIENLHKGGPIAIADFLLENNSDIASLHKKVDQFVKRLGLAQ